MEGLIAAMRCNIKATGTIGIYDKRYGVLFKRITTLKQAWEQTPDPEPSKTS
jgi:hypothetical protein